ncbi:MAG: dipeptidase [Candidatus Kapabacteria bacterium]|nr:dipeptidase [Ignavibacteriota bacterium]MCW5884954.1 dipeptidase [Candidatus Kapabacteria bacterium]
MDRVLSYIEANKERHLAELFDFLKIPSVSSVPDNALHVRECALWLVDHIKNIGIENCRLMETPGHPIVYGEWLSAGNDAPTVLVYGHYDVQPVDPLELWKSKPFDPTIKDGKIFGRGTSDDKGQVFTHLKAIETHLAIHGKLPVNIKLLIEGEEECGSSHLEDFIKENKDLLNCDTVLISDTEWFSDGLPSICYSLRGISYIEVFVTGPNRDLHSGTYGGAVDNPIQVLAEMIASLKDSYGRITIPGFYDDVLELSDDERNGFKLLPFDYKEYCDDLEVGGGNGEYGYSTLERTWARPSLDVNGIVGGYTGEGAKTVLPSKASAKISMRLVPHQNYQDISNKITEHLLKIAPPTVRVEVSQLHGGNPVLVPRDSIGVKAAMTALKTAFGIDPVFMREGGSIPIVNVFTLELNSPTVLMGLGLPGDNIHSPNESFAVENFYGGIRASAIFFDEYSNIKKI